MSEAIAIACGVTLFFGVTLLIIFGFFGYLRYLKFKETVLLAEKGLLHPQENGAGKTPLVWGIVITALGMALCLGLYPLGWSFAPGQFPLNFGPWMLLGLVPTFFGLALVLIYVLTRRPAKPVEPVAPAAPVIPEPKIDDIQPIEPESQL
jgi:hypothetical protein